MAGSINTITRGKKKYVVYKNCYRVKTDKKNSGRTRNTGKSEVITENKYLGTLENVLAKLMDKNKPAEFELERFGLEAAAIEVIERLEIRELLQKHFPASFSGVDTADYLIAAIIHRLHEAEPKSKIEDFINKSILKRHYGLDASKFNSQNYWKAYDSIISEKAIGVKRDKITELKKKELTEETRKQIEKLEIEFGQNKNIDNFQKDFLNVLMNKEKLHSEFLYIDSTNFYNYIENNNGKALLCAKGKSKAGKNFLNQITLSIAATAEYGIPLVNEIYKGNYNDITLFPTFITKVIGQYAAVYKNADELFVSYDKGNNSEDNYSEMEAAAKKNNIQVSVVGSLRQDWHKEFMDISLKKFKNKKSDYAYYSCEKKVFGKKQKIVVTYHKSSAARQEIKLNQKIEELTKKIQFYFDGLTEEYKTNLTDEKLQKYIEKNITQYNPAKKILKVKIIRETEKKQELIIELDKNELENERKTFGKTILFSSDDSLEPNEIIKLYHGKNKIDELHKILKCPSGVMFHPNWVWTDSKLMVQAFVNIMALTILKLIEKKFKESESEYSANALLVKEILESIQLVLVVESLNISRKAVNKFTMPAQQHLFTLFNMERFLK